MKHRDGVAAVTPDARPAELASEVLRLSAANINPMTGLATDYLNHFNEAIMLLESLISDPELRDDFLRWRPMSYCDHFAASRFESRSAAIAAYERADREARDSLDALTDAMTAVLEAMHATLNMDLPHTLAGVLASEASAALRPLVARAGAVINGGAHGDGGESPQAAVDNLMKA